ncbi:MAG TPA: 3-deoxy-7-phosphoheptulonate synthase [Candidatus Merdivicinus faecavium]|nr:3-deoxy-7-phosphoheptulonate synthase [Candidatus Merdivicinus faecavium]
MIIVLKKNTNPEEVQKLIADIESCGNIKANTIIGEQSNVIGLVGDTTRLNEDDIAANEIVESVKRVQEPYKMANRKFHPDDSVIEVPAADGPVSIGGKEFQIIAGPCSVESAEQISDIARSVKASGAKLLRGGAFKPRTSPYAFQGLHDEGIRLLLEAKKATGLPIVTEIMSPAHLPLFEEVDVIQVGARNMQNFELLKELGTVRKPVLLKRGLANTLEELLMSAEYIMAAGNPNVILCERGIRTFETATRNTLDISAIPMLKKASHLPVIVDPSHACGIAWMVEPMAKAAAAVGADGLIIEVHNNPQKALCDGKQSITPDAFAKLVETVRPFAALNGRTL